MPHNLAPTSLAPFSIPSPPAAQHLKAMGEAATDVAKEGLTVPTPGNIKELVYGKQ